MAILEPHQIRQRVAAAIAAHLAAEDPPWREMSTAMLMAIRDGRAATHKGYQVGLTDTEILDERRRVRSGEQPARAQTTLVVRWAYQLKANDQVQATDDALATEALMMAAIATTSMEGIGTMVPRRVRRRVDEQSDWHLTEIELEVRHMYQVS